MFASPISRILLSVAIGGGAAAWLAMRYRRRGRPSPWRPPPDWYSDHRPGPDGCFDEDALADQASQDSFPASDPPAHMTSVVIGSPAR